MTGVAGLHQRMRRTEPWALEAHHSAGLFCGGSGGQGISQSLCNLPGLSSSWGWGGGETYELLRQGGPYPDTEEGEKLPERPPEMPLPAVWLLLVSLSTPL